MNHNKQYSGRFPSALGRLQSMLVLCSLAIIFYGTIYAQGVCIKNVSGSLTLPLDGVVAAGTVTGGCAVDAPWTEVAPVEFLPAASSPGGYMFLGYYDPPGPANSRFFIGIDLAGDEDLSDQDVVYVLFDATNDNTFNAGDFYIKVVVSNSTSPITSGELCSQPHGAVEYYEHNGTTWQLVTTAGVASAINVGTALDYIASGGEPPEIWNLEIDMPVGLTIGATTYFNLQTVSPYFGIGAYVFVDDGHQQTPQQGTVLKWPDAMVDRTITQQNMGGIPSSQANELADATLENECFDVNFSVTHPLEINGEAAEPHDNHVIRDANNSFRVTFYFDGPGSNTAPLTNTGTVKLSLLPFNTSPWVEGEAWIKTVVVDAEEFNHATTVEFTYDFGHRPQSWIDFENTYGLIDFVCADLFLENFDLDDNTSNNSRHINNNEFTTSTYSHYFFVNGTSLPSIKAGESTTIFLRFQSNNETPNTTSQQGSTLPFTRFSGSDKLKAFGLVTLAAILIIVVLSFLRHNIPRTKKIAGISLLIVLAMLVQCDCERRPPKIGTDRWEITNARKLGIEPVEGKKDWYQMPLSHGEIKRVNLEFSARPLPYQTRQHRYTPLLKDTTLNVLRIPVNSTEVTTVLAYGQIDLDGDGPLPPTSPTGFIDGTGIRQGNLLPPGGILHPTRQYLLTAGYYSPHEYAGALIGSFNNFESSFVVSRNSSIIVPEGADTLSLAVNANLSAIPQITGFFDIFTIATPRPKVPTHTQISGDATYQIPPTLPLWNTLTSLKVYTYYQTQDMDEIGNLVGQTMHPWGFAHYSIYDSHLGQ